MQSYTAATICARDMAPASSSSATWPMAPWIFPLRPGPPLREGEGGHPEGLEWRGERTIARLMPDYFVVVTRAYAALLDAPAALPRAELPTLASYPWYLQLVEGFAWARDPGFRGPGSDRVNP
jgi:hypothetical protein